MSILTKLQDLRIEEENTLTVDVTVSELWERIRQMMASRTTTWATVTATAPQPDAQVLFPASMARGIVIFDYI